MWMINNCKAKPGHKKILSMTIRPVEKLGWQEGGGETWYNFIYQDRTLVASLM
jgi:hypothetical protein